MKVIFDTNILISGFLTATGSSQYIITRAFKKHSVIVSDYILKEFQEKLINKLDVPHDVVAKALYFLKKRAFLLKVSEEPQVDFSDKKDIPILNLVCLSKAHYFVTGDKSLLRLKKLGPTVFLNPREAMTVL